MNGTIWAGRGETVLDRRRPWLRIASSLVAALCVFLLSLAAAAPAHALTGSQYNNTLPYEQGCGQGAYVITSKAIFGGTASMVYSPKCQTNWIEWYGPSRFTSKTMHNPARTAAENDTAGWSYSRQVYAPGATVARGEIIVWGNAAGSGSQWWSVRCSSTCQWALVN